MDGASTENVSQPNQDQTGSNGEMKSNVARNTEQLHQSLSASTSQVDKKDAETVDSVQHESVNINNDLSSSKNTKEQVPHLSQNGLPTGATDSESIHTNTLVNQAKTVSSANDAILNESIASRTTAESPQNLSMGDSQGSIPSQTIPAVSVHSVTGISQNCADSQHSIPCNSQASKMPEQNSITEHKSEIVNTSTCTSSTANVTPHVSEQNISSSVETKSVSSSQQVTLSSSSNPSNIVSHPQTSLTTHLLANTTSQSVGQLSQTVLQSQNSALSENSIVTSQSTFPNVQPVVETGQSKMQTTHIPTPSSRTEAGINRPHSVSVSHLQPVVPHQQDAASVQTVMSQQIHESRVSITGSITHTSEAIPTPDTHGLLHAPQEHVRVTQQMSVPPANTTKQAPRMPHHRGQNPTKTKRQSKTSQAQKSEIPPVSHPHMMPRIMQEFARGMPQIPQMFDPRMIAAMSNFGDPRLQRFSDPRIVSEMQQRFALLRMRMEKQFALQQQQHHQGSQAHASHAGLSHGQDATQQQQEAGMHQSASVSHPSQPPTQRSFQSQEQVGTYVSQPQHTPMSVHEQHLLQNQSQTIQEHGALSHASQMPVMSSHPSNTQQSSMAHPHAHGNQSHSRMAPNEISYQPSINPPNSRQQAGSQGTPPQDDIKNTGLMMGLGPQDPSVPHHDTPVQASTPNNIPTHGGIGHPALPASSSQMVSQAVNKPPSAQPQTVTWAEAARVPTSYPGHQFVPASVGSPTYPLSGAKDDIKPVPVLSAGQGRPPSAGSSRPPSAEGSSRPPSAGRPQSGGRPPSTGRPPSVGRPPSGGRPPSAGRPQSAGLIHQPTGITPGMHPLSDVGVSSASQVPQAMPGSLSNKPSNQESSSKVSSQQQDLQTSTSSAITQTPYSSEETPVVTEAGAEASSSHTGVPTQGDTVSTQSNIHAPSQVSTTVSTDGSQPASVQSQSFQHSAPIPQGYVRTPFGMLPHHPPGIAQGGGVPYTNMPGTRPFHPHMLPPGMQPNMGMPPGFPPGFRPSHMQRMPPHSHMPQESGMPQGPMQTAIASLAQQVSSTMQVPTSGQSGPRPPMPGTTGTAGVQMPMGVPGSQGMPTPQQMENLFRMSLGMRSQPPMRPGMPPMMGDQRMQGLGMPPRMPRQYILGGPGPRMPGPMGEELTQMSPTHIARDSGAVSAGNMAASGNATAMSGIQPSQMPPQPAPRPPSGNMPPLHTPSPSAMGNASSTPSPTVHTPPVIRPDQPGSMDTVVPEVKIEPGLAGDSRMSQEDIDARTATQNALLKQLLANSSRKAQVQRQQSAVSEDSEDSSQVVLTPEQQKQLELIEKMPLVMESELTAEDWDSKTPEERECILGRFSQKIEAEMKKQAYEQRRKEFELLRKQKRKVSGETRKRKKKEKPPEVEGQAPAPGQEPPQQQQQTPTPPKKRQRKSKKQSQEAHTEDLDAKAEQFLHTLRSLPTVSLQEPRVGNFFNISPVHGSAAVITGGNQLKGPFGKSYLEGVADFYGNTLLRGLPPLGSFVGLPRPRDIETRRKYLGAGPEDVTPDYVRLSFGDRDEKFAEGNIPEQQRYHLATDRFMLPGMNTESPLQPPGHRVMAGFGSPLIGMGEKPHVPTLPPSPRIEPRLADPYRGGDSPLTVVSSSSPEHEFGDDEEDEFPMLRPIEPLSSTNDDRTSPSVPIVQPIAVKAAALKIKEEPQLDFGNDLSDKKPVTDKELSEKKLQRQDPALTTVDKENMSGKMPSLSSLTRPFREANMNQDISVTLTLSANAAEDIGGVLSQIAELLKIAVPPSYEVSRSPSPEMFKMNMKHREEPVNIHSLIKSKAKFCRHCDTVVLDAGFRVRKSEIPFLVNEDYFSFRDFDDEEVTFCSEKCYTKFATVYQTINKPPPPELREEFSSNHKSQSLGLFTPKSQTSIADIISPKSSETLTPTTPTKSDALMTPNSLTPTSVGTLTPGVQASPPIRQPSEEKMAKKHRRTSSLESQIQKPLVKKWKDVRYKKWDPSFTQTLGTTPGVPEREIENLWKALGTIIVPQPQMEETRKCAFCQTVGDGETDGTGRLLNMDINKWAHLNCALWSSEVYETLNGALMNVDVAFTRGQTIECAHCKIKGATVGCFNMRCPKYYHLGCAKKVGCMLFQDKTILCPTHAPKQGAENVLESLAVYRRVYINRNEDKQVADMVHGQEEGHHTLRIGSLVLHSVGQLLPHQIQTGRFHNSDSIYPVGFKSSRLYWSMRRLYKRCRYISSITESDGHPVFNIRVVEPNAEDILLQDKSPTDVWKKVLEPLDRLRRNADLVKIFPNFITGEEMFGLTEPAIVRVIESLPGTDLLTKYTFKFSRSLRIEMPLTINPTGCARTEPKLRTHFRKPHTLQSSNTSRSLPATVTGITGDINSPYMKQFVHSKSQQYRRLKTEWRNNVYLGRSRIQGLGLFAARDLEKHTMVIEYIGDLIRNEVANRKEMLYEEQNRGVYMFRIDNETVVDATMAGGPARYINHSCNPDCVAEVVPFDKESKIIIITNRRIPKGEELTYDYKFDFEDEQHKIPCCCGAPNCRKWMN